MLSVTPAPSQIFRTKYAREQAYEVERARKEKTKRLRLVGRNKPLPRVSMKMQMLFTYDRDWRHLVLPFSCIFFVMMMIALLVS